MLKGSVPLNATTMAFAFSDLSVNRRTWVPATLKYSANHYIQSIVRKAFLVRRYIYLDADVKLMEVPMLKLRFCDAGKEKSQESPTFFKIIFCNIPEHRLSTFWTYIMRSRRFNSHRSSNRRSPQSSSAKTHKIHMRRSIANSSTNFAQHHSNLDPAINSRFVYCFIHNYGNATTKVVTGAVKQSYVLSAR